MPYKKYKMSTFTSEKERLTLEYAPLVHNIVQRMAIKFPSHIDLDDLMSSGIIGLMDAIDKFQPEKGVKFPTYAEARIRGAILDELRSMDWVPRSIRQKSKRIEEAYNVLETKFDRPATDEEIAQYLEMTLEEFYEMLNETRGISLFSIDQLDQQNGAVTKDKSLYSYIIEFHKETPFSLYQLKEIKEKVMDTLEKLPEKERMVASLYYYDELTMKEIGEILGISESRVSQLHSKIILRLRSKLKKMLDFKDDE
jgi:RNA polymerase sigma factor FliA